jgi:putative glutamine amidotransferase
MHTSLYICPRPYRVQTASQTLGSGVAQFGSGSSRLTTAQTRGRNATTNCCHGRVVNYETASHRRIAVSKEPRIGIGVGRETHVGRRFDATPHEYVAAVLQAGGLPLLIPSAPPELATRAVESIDGLLLTGGGDVSPDFYGMTTEPETSDVDEERDRSELALVAAATARGIPILGICRGAQLVNVAFGGTLRQHLPAKNGIRHTQPRRRYETVHRVVLEPKSLLAELIDSRELSVNSLHHQGIENVGQDLDPTGRADDGLVEVIENRDRRVLAVQWHPECLPLERASKRLFSWLVEESRRDQAPPS